MPPELGTLYVGIDCTNCGTHGEGVPADNGRTRCNKCGAFGQELHQYCQEHETDYSGRDHCPYCRMEEDRKAQERHMHTRDRRMEPW